MTDKPRVCLIYTGGTIGMEERDGVLQPPGDPHVFLRIAPELQELVEIEPDFLLNKDSTNINPDDWVQIARAIYDRRDEGYRGFVVAHGTDTMHFTASALAFAFGPKLRVPIVVTGAQTHPGVHHGDARVNLVRAFKAALEPLPEVCIAFGEYVFRGCRAQKKDERRFDAFESPAFPPLAYITETIDLQPLARKLSEIDEGPLDFRPVFAPGVLQVSLIPGLEPSLISHAATAPECTGVILQSFGAGNVPDSGSAAEPSPFSFEDLIKELVAQDTPVVITSQFPAGSTFGSKYATHLTAIQAGAIATGNMTSSAAAVKFRWVLAQVDSEIAAGQLMQRDRLDRIRLWMDSAYVGELGTTVHPFTERLPDASLTERPSSEGELRGSATRIR